MRKSASYIVFLFCLYMFTFQFALMRVNGFFQYWDEIYAIICIPLFLFKKEQNLKVKVNINTGIIILLILFSAIGLVGNIIYQYQCAAGIFQDILLNLKFFMGILTTFLLFSSFHINCYSRKIQVHIRIIITVLFLFYLLDKIFGMFPIYEVRYGLNSEQLFFGHPTGLASVAFFLLIMNMILYEGKIGDIIFILMTLLLEISTLRIKAIAVSILFVYMYFVIMIMKKKIGWLELLPGLIPVMIVAYDMFYSYFFSSIKMETARGALLYKSFDIARDCFPFGTGFGTYASAPSGVWYSSVYTKYGLNTVWGLSKGNSSFVCDSFWAMIIGQNGYIGLAIYIIIIICLIAIVSKLFRININMYMVGMSSLLYLLISSTSESAFVNPLSLPLSFTIGLALLELCRLKNRGVVVHD